MDFFSNVPRWHGSVMISRGGQDSMGICQRLRAAVRGKILDVHGSASPSSPFFQYLTTPFLASRWKLNRRRDQDIIVPLTRDQVPQTKMRNERQSSGP